MRIAFISDIHGNLHSLDIVLNDIQNAQVDQVICLGDVASLGPQPREVIARLREMGIPVVMGNHDNYLLNPHLIEDQIPWLRKTEQWGLEQLSAEDLDYLRSFQPELPLALDENTTALCFHGSPQSNEEFLYPDTPTERLSELFDQQTAKLMVFGHTHVQMVSQHKDMTLLNPGSTGTPFEFPFTGPDRRILQRAEYAIVDMTDGRLNIELRQLPIDFDQLAEISRASGMPDVEFWLSTWIK